MHKGPRQTTLIFLALATALAAMSIPKAHAQVFKIAALARPVILSLATWQPAIDLATAAGIYGFSAFVIKNYSTDPASPLPSLQGQSINSIDLSTGSSTTPLISVVVDPSAMPKNMPSTWKFDSGSNISFDPAVNSAPGTISPSSNTWSWSGSLCGNQVSYSGNVGSIASQALSYANSTCPANPPYTIANVNEVNGNWDFVVGGHGYTQLSIATGPAPAPSSSSSAKPSADPSNPPMWPADGNCTVVRVGNTFSGSAQDPDCWLGGNKKNGPSPPPPGVIETPTSVGASNGQGSSTNVVVNPDGSIRITNTSPNSTGTGTVQNVIDLAPPNAGQLGSTVVTGQVQNTFNGTGTQTSSTPVTLTSPATAPATTLPATTPVPATLPATPSTDPCVANPALESCQVNPGSPSPTDGLYTPQTGICATFVCILDSMAAKVKSSQLWASTVGFFRVPSGAGSCGGLSTTFNIFGRSIDMNIDSIFCGPLAEKAYLALSIVLIITVTVTAFTIAIL